MLGWINTDWSMHLSDDRCVTEKYCCSLQNFSAYPTCFLFTLFTCLFVSSSLSLFSPHRWDTVRISYACKWLFPSFPFSSYSTFPFSCLSPNPSCPALSLTDFALTVKGVEEDQAWGTTALPQELWQTLWERRIKDGSRWGRRVTAGFGVLGVRRKVE